MKKNARKFVYLVVLMLFVCFTSKSKSIDVLAEENDSGNGDSYAYVFTPALTDATYDYLNDIYINKYPDLGLSYLYGSEADQQVIDTMTQKIIANCKTKKEKAEAITKWVKKNIEYRSYNAGTYYYPTDVFYHRTGNCLGRSELMIQMMRLADIPAVLCVGMRGDMETTCKLNQIEMDHGWVMAFCDDDWYLYDANFDEYGTNDRDYISKWYFIDNVEGVATLFDQKLYSYIGYGNSLYYIDGRFMYYAQGIPASEYYGNGAEGGLSLQMCISFFCKTKYNGPTGNDGFEYVDNPERKEKMINDESYSNGFLTYGSTLYYAKPNGTLASNQFIEKDGKTYFCSYDGTMLEVQSNTENFTTIDGYIAVHEGIDQIKLLPTWIEDQQSEGRVVVWESNTPEIATVDQEGNISILEDGLATFEVDSRDSVDSDSHYCSSFVQLYVTKESYRSYSYEDMEKPEIGEDERQSVRFCFDEEQGKVEWKKKSITGEEPREKLKAYEEVEGESEAEYDVFMIQKPAAPEDYDWENAPEEERSQYGNRAGEKPVVVMETDGQKSYLEVDDCGDDDICSWHFTYALHKQSDITIFWSANDEKQSGDIHVHVLTKVSAKTPTCKEKGNKEYYVCQEDSCKMWFADANGLDIIENHSSVVLERTNEHIWDGGQLTKEPTETDTGVKTFTCSVCSETKTEEIPKHEKKETVQPSAENGASNVDEENGTTIVDEKNGTAFVITGANESQPTASFVSLGNNKEKNVVVPKSVEVDGVTYQVTAIADGAFKNNKSMKKVTIPKTVTVVGKEAFSGCSKLKSISIGSQVTTIEADAFKNCKELSEVKLPAKTTKIGAKAFAGCGKLKRITIQNKKLKIKNISKDAFKGISSKTVIKVPKGKVKEYKAMFRKRGLSKKVVVK